MKVIIKRPLKVPDTTQPGEQAIGLEFMQNHGLQRDEDGYVTLPPGEYEVETRKLINGRNFFIKGTRLGAHMVWWDSLPNAELIL